MNSEMIRSSCMCLPEACLCPWR